MTIVMMSTTIGCDEGEEKEGEEQDTSSIDCDDVDDDC